MANQIAVNVPPFPFPVTYMGRLLVTGSRSWNEDLLIRQLLAQAWIAGFRFVAHGQSPGGGADLLADRQARLLGFTVIPFPVDHAIDGPWPGAGPRRNERMIEAFKPHRGLSFRSPGLSRGTDNCVRLLEDREIPVVRGSGL